MPKRIQRKRTKGWRMPEGAVYVGRPHTFGNPFTGKWAASRYRRWITGKMSGPEFYRLKDADSWALHTDRQWVRQGLAQLRGRDLACWCRLCDRHADGKPLGELCADCAPCHADVLLELANAPEGKGE